MLFRIFYLVYIIFPSDREISYLKLMSALLWMLLEVEIEPLLPFSEVSILNKGPTNLSDAESDKIRSTHLKRFDGLSESFVILLEQECLN